MRRVGAHAGVVVWRTDDPVVAVLKHISAGTRGQREADTLVALRAQVPSLRAPRLRLSEAAGEGAWLLGFEDARRGLDARISALDVEHAGRAAALLASVHPLCLPGLPGDPARDVALASEDAKLPAELRAALGRLVVIGDAVCHGDLHPSNWLTTDGVPVGLLDWASARRGDPEHDLARLVLALRAGLEPVEAVCSAWNQASGRRTDPTRLLLYLWLEVEQQRRRTPGKPRLDALSMALAQRVPRSPPPDGGTRVERVAPPAEGAGFWVPQTEGAHPVVEALRRPDVLGAGSDIDDVCRYGGHACNDVFRVRVEGEHRIVKVYNKPVPPWLFPLERALSDRVEGGARVLAPLPLRGGGDLFRVQGRPAALYADAGTQRVGNSPADARRQAAALAALHRVTGLGETFPRMRDPAPRMDWALVQGDVGTRIDAALLAQVEDAWAQVVGQVARVDNPDLPETLQHGSLHRDHTAVAADGALVIFDLEKARLGPAIDDVVRTAAFVGYRGNDERLSPERIVGFVRAYARLRPLAAAERALLVPLLMRCLVHDLRAMAQEDHSDADLTRHAGVVVAVARNAANLEAAFARYL